MPASLIAAGDALARFFAAPEIGSVPHRSARQGILILVAFIGGMLPISNMAMLSSAYLALSGDFNADLIDLGAELRKIGGENGGRYFYHFNRVTAC